MTRPAALFALHVAVALFGFAGLFGKWLALSPVAIVLGRTVVAAAALAALVYRRRQPSRPTVALAANGAWLALHWIAFFHAIQISSVAVGLLGYASFPLFVLPLERRAGRPWAMREGATALLVTVGLLVLLPSLSWQDRTVQGIAFGVLSGFMFAVLVVRGRSLVASGSATTIALWQNAFAALLLVPVAAATHALPRPPTLSEVAAILVLGVVCTALAHTLFIASMRNVSAHTASIVAGLEPVYGIVLAAILLHEWPGLRTIAGAALIVGAAIIASRPGPGSSG